MLELPDGDRKGALHPMMHDAAYARMMRLVSGETPEAILSRLAARLNCKPEQACDIVIRMLEEKRNVRKAESSTEAQGTD